MTRWEYKMVGHLDVEDANKLGADGWELVGFELSVSSETNSDNVLDDVSGQAYAWFKRPLTSEPES